MIKGIYIFFIVIVSLLFAGCQSNENSQELGEEEPEAIETHAPQEEVVVSLMNDQGLQVATATLVEKSSGGVQITLEGDNLPPGEHGFHIHDVGECTPSDFSSAGGHYNPTNSKHGFDHAEGPHAGDLENITVKEDGTIYAYVDALMVSLKRDHDNTLYTKAGTSLVIHANPDDYVTQPSGDSGSRIACGVIGK